MVIGAERWEQRFRQRIEVDRAPAMWQRINRSDRRDLFGPPYNV